MSEKVDKHKPLEIPDFEDAYEKARFWNQQLITVVNTMKLKLNTQKAMKKNADYREADKSVQIVEQAQESMGILLIDHQIILNKLKQKSDEQ